MGRIGGGKSIGDPVSRGHTYHIISYNVISGAGGRYEEPAGPALFYFVFTVF